MLLICTGCSNNTTEESNVTLKETKTTSIEKSQHEDIENKISSFKREVALFKESTKSFLPRDINNCNRLYNELLKEILLNKESISSTPEDILGDSKEFYLKFGNVLNIGSNYFRFIEFGKSVISDGSMIYLYLQIWDEDNVVTLQNLDTIVQTASGVGEFIFYDFIEIDGLYYTNIFSSIKGVDSNYFYLSSYRIDDTKLTKFHSNTEFDKLVKWNVRKYEEENKFIIGYNNNRNYSCNFSDKNIIINALDDDGKILSSLKIVLSEEGYRLEENSM